MAITVENGTGLSNANSYAAVAFADTFHTDRGNSEWAVATTAAKEAALVRATDYIDSNYVFPGSKLTASQALANPRLGETALKAALTRATALLALYALSTSLFPTLATDRVTSRTEKLDGVGSIAETFDDAATDRYPAVTAMLKDIIVTASTSEASSYRLTR